MWSERVAHALGLAAKAGKLVYGTPMVCEALRGKNKPFLVIAASDNSGNTEKRLCDKCAFYGTEMLLPGADGETLAAAVGKSGKIAALAVTDEHLCRLIRSSITEEL